MSETPNTSPPSLEERVVEAISRVYDPEIPVNIYELGLIYNVEVQGDQAEIKMTLTSPHCPVAESLPIQVEQTVEAVDGIEKATVEIVWDPAWNPAMMSDAAKLELGMF
ncbi:MAG: iron-sulfur cluster assembly protein [Acidobacteriota bacterium]